MVPSTASANMVSGHSREHDRPPMERHNGSALSVGSSCCARSPMTLETSRRRRSMCRPLGLLEQDAQECADLAPVMIARGGGSGLCWEEGMACTAPARGPQKRCMVTPSRKSIEVRLGRQLPIRESDRSIGLSCDTGSVPIHSESPPPHCDYWRSCHTGARPKRSPSRAAPMSISSTS